MNPATFGKNLKEVLVAIDMKPIDLAKLTGLTTSGISMIMTGKRDPKLSTVLLILKVLPVKFERLVRE